jgi:hypothetical protein
MQGPPPASSNPINDINEINEMNQINQINESEVRTDMGGIFGRRNHKTKNVELRTLNAATVFFMAVLALVMVLGFSVQTAVACTNTGDYVQGSNGDQFTISVGGTPVTQAPLGSVLHLEFRTTTQFNDETQIWKIKSGDNANTWVNNAPGNKTVQGGTYIYSYDFDTSTDCGGPCTDDFLQIEVTDKGDNIPKIKTGFELGNPGAGIWFYNDAARTEQSDTFYDGQTVYARATFFCTDTLKNFKINSWNNSNTNLTANGWTNTGGNTYEWSFTIDFATPGITDGDWGSIEVQLNTNACGKHMRMVKRDESIPPTGCVSCSDPDPATLTTTAPTSGSTVGGVYTIQTQVGTETAPDTMTNMVVNVAGSSACNVTNGPMTWNAGTSRWEYSWNTSACGTGTAETGITIDVSGNDPDCNTAVNAAQITNITIDNT